MTHTIQGMDTVDNYYAILGVPIDADSDTIKRAYRQLARQFHPDVAGPEGALQMKRINRAYDVLSNSEQRLNYDTIISGVIDVRNGGLTRPRPVSRRFNLTDDLEFSGLSAFSTKGPLRSGASLRAQMGVLTSLASASATTTNGMVIAAGSLDGKVLLWNSSDKEPRITLIADPALTVESLRAMRFSPDGSALAGWGRLGLHVWDTSNGQLLWSHSLMHRAVSAWYSLDVAPQDSLSGSCIVMMALPLLPNDALAPRSQGVRGSDVLGHVMNVPRDELTVPLVCEEETEKRHFWQVRLRALASDAQTLVTLSCAHVPHEEQEMIVARRWNLAERAGFRGKSRSSPRPRIAASIILGNCADYIPPYLVTPDAEQIALVYKGNNIRLYDTERGTFNELACGSMGGNAKLALSTSRQWLAIAREDSEVNEGVVDLWSLTDNKLLQRLYHPWQISALHFSGQSLIVALTNGTIHIWE
jgi:WD40 repeat protein